MRIALAVAFVVAGTRFFYWAHENLMFSGYFDGAFLLAFGGGALSLWVCDAILRREGRDG